MRLSERSDLPFIGAREGGERLRQELKGTRETKRTGSSRRGAPFGFSVLVCGKNLDIRAAPRRAEAGGGGGGARVDVPLVLMLIQVGKEPPL